MTEREQAIEKIAEQLCADDGWIWEDLLAEAKTLLGGKAQSDYLRQVNHILNLTDSRGRLLGIIAKNQTPPKCTLGTKKFGMPNSGYKEGQEDMQRAMLDAGFKLIDSAKD